MLSRRERGRKKERERARVKEGENGKMKRENREGERGKMEREERGRRDRQRDKGAIVLTCEPGSYLAVARLEEMLTGAHEV